MNRQNPVKTFLGRGWGFPPEFHRQDRQVRMVSEDEDIQESLKILLSTRPGERVMQPTYGCGIHSMVFESINESTITDIKDRIQRSILFFETRIDVNNIAIDTAHQGDGALHILVDYTIRTTNSRSNMVYPFYLKEGTDTGFAEGR